MSIYGYPFIVVSMLALWISTIQLWITVIALWVAITPYRNFCTVKHYHAIVDLEYYIHNCCELWICIDKKTHHNDREKPEWGWCCSHNSIHLDPITWLQGWRGRHLSCPHSIRGYSRVPPLLLTLLSASGDSLTDDPKSSTLEWQVHSDRLIWCHGLVIPLHLQSAIIGI